MLVKSGEEMNGYRFWHAEMRQSRGLYKSREDLPYRPLNCVDTGFCYNAPQNVKNKKIDFVFTSAKAHSQLNCEENGMIYKSEKETRVINGRIVECIEKDCKQPANIEGFCWEHYGQQKKEDLT